MVRKTWRQWLGHILHDFSRPSCRHNPHCIRPRLEMLENRFAPAATAAGPAVGLAFVAQPVSTPTGASLPPVQVQLVDALGNRVADNTDSVTLSVASGP